MVAPAAKNWIELSGIVFPHLCPPPFGGEFFNVHFALQRTLARRSGHERICIRNNNNNGESVLALCGGIITLNAAILGQRASLAVNQASLKYLCLLTSVLSIYIHIGMAEGNKYTGSQSVAEDAHALRTMSNEYFILLTRSYLFVYVCVCVFKPFSVQRPRRERGRETDKIALCVFNKESHFLDLPRNLGQIKSCAEKYIKIYVPCESIFRTCTPARDHKNQVLLPCPQIFIRTAPSFGPLVPGA